MFKKRSKRPATLRAPDSIVDDSTTDESVAAQIASTKKRRTLISSVQTNNGLDSTLLSKATAGPVSDIVSDAATIDSEKNSRFGKTTLAGSDEKADAASTLEAKHKKALEQYIAMGLKQNGIVEDKPAPVSTTTTNSVYEELSAQVVTAGTDAAGNEWINGELVTKEQLQQRRDADVMDGGAVLGGTGIAEVILPTVVRQKNVEDTSRALKKMKDDKKAGQAKSEEGGIGGNVASNFVQNKRNWDEKLPTHNANKEAAKEASTVASEAEQLDADRPGYMNAEDKKKASKAKQSTGGGGASSDHKVMKRFFNNGNASKR